MFKLTLYCVLYECVRVSRAVLTLCYIPLMISLSQFVLFFALFFVLFVLFVIYIHTGACLGVTNPSNPGLSLGFNIFEKLRSHYSSSKHTKHKTQKEKENNIYIYIYARLYMNTLIMGTIRVIKNLIYSFSLEKDIYVYMC